MKSLLNEIALGIMAIRPDAVDALMPQVQAFITGQAVANTRTVDKWTEKELMMEAGLSFFTEDGRRVAAGIDEVTPESGMVAVLNISGAVMKN
ncbi:MAG TPA: hypothetical protein PKY96_18440, partial [Flavobacteriales bacterium]|nr:hypothetical protein [Flavobacteriales bacterium]